MDVSEKTFKSDLLDGEEDLLDGEDDYFNDDLHNLDPGLLKVKMDILKQAVDFYTEENSRLEETLKSLRLANKELIDSYSTQFIDKMKNIQEALNVFNVNTNSVALSHVGKLRKQNNYVSKLKVCTKLYVNLNEKLSSELKSLKWEFGQSKKKVNLLASSNDEDLKSMEMKIKRYENSLLKFEKKYPWLKDPEFSLPHISREADTLIALKDEKEKLEQELSKYHGLQPSLREATHQLAKVKAEYQEINDQLLQTRKHISL